MAHVQHEKSRHPHFRTRQQYAGAGARPRAGTMAGAHPGRHFGSRGCAGAGFAAAQRIRTVVVEARAHTRASFEAALMEAIDALAADFIVLAGFMRILTPAFVARYAQRILNIHPSLLPSFPGLNTHQRALEAGVQLHGATVHFVTPRLDDGPIIAQAAVPVMATDDAGTLAARVLEAEHQLYPRALRWCVEGRLSVQNARAFDAARAAVADF